MNAVFIYSRLQIRFQIHTVVGKIKSQFEVVAASFKQQGSDAIVANINRKQAKNAAPKITADLLLASWI